MITYTRLITDEDQKCLENDLLDIADWINKAIEGKINNCMKRAAKQYESLARAKNIPLIPPDDRLKAQELFKQVGYQNRQARDLEDQIRGE